MRVTRYNDHHPACPGGCGELADECRCIDGRNPRAIEHLCIKDHLIHDGPVEDCCLMEWREERAALG
jgi:hypothetical protein